MSVDSEEADVPASVTQLRHRHRLVCLKRVGRAPLKAGVDCALVFAEISDNGLLAFLHHEKPAAQPDQCHHADDQASANAGVFHVGLKARTTATRTVGAIARSCRSFAAEQAAELVVEVAPEFVQVGRAIALAGTENAATGASS